MTLPAGAAKACRLAGIALVIAAGPPGARAGGLDMTADERRAFGAEVRATLLAHPELAAPALEARAGAVEGAGPRDAYAEDVRRDLDLIESRAAALFGPDRPGFGPAGARAALALFTREGCAECAAAEADLRAIARKLDLRVTILDADAEAALAAALGLDMAPSYVLPDMMLRGRMPPVVLERYLAR